MIVEDSEGNICIKIVDFGSARKLKHRDQIMHSLHGSLFYVAPEVFASNYKMNCDIWSIGVIVYSLLTGLFPFEEELLPLNLDSLE